MSYDAPAPPFARGAPIAVVLPTTVAHLSPADQHLLAIMRPVLAENRAALARELGVRQLRLLPHWRLTVSTALTYDRQGRSIEHADIPVDRLIQPDRWSPSDDDVVLRSADQHW